MGYRIGSVRMVGYGPFADAEVDLSRPGITLLEGVMAGSSVCDSNGAGKSTVINAALWAIYGRTMQGGVPGDDVIHHGARVCRVRVSIVGGGEPVVVERERTRGRGGVRLRLLVGGEDQSAGTAATTQREVEGVIGMDFATFMSSVAFGARDDVRGFLAATDSERKRLFDSMLGLDRFTVAERAARDKLSRVRDSIGESESKAAGLRGEGAEAARALERAVGDADDNGDAELERKDRGARLVVMRNRLERERRALARLADARDREEAAFSGVLARHRKLVDAAEAERAVYAATARDRRMEAGRLEGEAAGVRRRLGRLAGLGDVCRECGQPVDPDLHARMVADLKAQADAADARANTLLMEAEAAEMDAAMVPVPDAPVSDSLDEAQMQVAEAEGAVRELEGDVGVLEARVDADRERAADRERSIHAARTRVAFLDGAIAGAEDELAALRETERMAEFWVHGFGPHGIKSFLIESEVAEIGVVASRYAARLLGPGTMVHLSATRRLKSRDESREEITVSVNIPQCAQTYRTASKGQRRRMDLSVLLALRDTAMRRIAQPIDQLFVDEMFDGLDPSGVDAVCELLREVGRTCPVLLITHVPDLRDVADRVAVAYHTGERAELRLESGW